MPIKRYFSLFGILISSANIEIKKSISRIESLNSIESKFKLRLFELEPILIQRGAKWRS